MRRGSPALGATLAAALLVSGCAADRVTLLDNEDGAKEFAVADITDPAGERVIDGQLQELKLGRRSAPRTLKEIRERDARLVTGLPLKPYEKDFFFETGDFKLSPAQLAELDAIKQAALDRAPALIEVEGFTDTEGDEGLNNDISKKRASAVVAQLRAAQFDVLDDNIVARGEYEARKQGDKEDTPNPLYRKVKVIVR